MPPGGELVSTCEGTHRGAEERHDSWDEASRLYRVSRIIITVCQAGEVEGRHDGTVARQRRVRLNVQLLLLCTQ